MSDYGPFVFLGERYTTQAELNEAIRRESMAVETITQEWERRVRALIETARNDVLREALDLARLAEDGDLEAVIVATPDGENLPGTTISKEVAIGYASLITDLAGFIDGQASSMPEGVTRRRVVNAR